MSGCIVRRARPDDEAAAYRVCLETGNYGEDAASLYREDPDALGRIFAGPYLSLEPELGLVLEDAEGVCGYVLGALDSRRFYARYDAEWRPRLCAQFPEAAGDPQHWAPARRVHHLYHHPDYFCPEPYDEYPSHLHIDLLPRAQGQGHGRRLLENVTGAMRDRGSPGVHLGVSLLNARARAFYEHLGFRELTRTGADADTCVYMGMRLGS